MGRKTKKEIYAEHGIEYISKGGYLVTPWGQKIKPVLKDGNDKLGKLVKNFSMLPTDQPVTVNMGTKENPDYQTFQGTCCCTCKDENGEVDCYACRGRCAMDCCRRCWAIHTTLAREYMSWLENAIAGQIEADNIKIVRVHVSGDFFASEYIDMWHRIATNHNDVIFWTYTKVQAAENAFDDVANFNVVKSVIPGVGLNFGTCAYIIAAYEYLVSKGLKDQVYICRCGIDSEQHCQACNNCFTKMYVLFLEHSTSYKASEDSLLPVLAAIIESQEKPIPVIAA